MKKITQILSILSLALVLTACTTPEYTPATPTTPATTNWVVDPKLTTALTTIGAVNTATAPVNPFSGAVDIALAAALALAGWVAKRKNDANNLNSSLLKAVIQGVENADDAKVKEAIQKQATAVGVESKLGSVVQKVNNGSI